MIACMQTSPIEEIGHVCTRGNASDNDNQSAVGPIVNRSRISLRTDYSRVEIWKLNRYKQWIHVYFKSVTLEKRSHFCLHEVPCRITKPFIMCDRLLPMSDVQCLTSDVQGPMSDGWRPISDVRPCVMSSGVRCPICLLSHVWCPRS